MSIKEKAEAAMHGGWMSARDIEELAKALIEALDTIDKYREALDVRLSGGGCWIRDCDYNERPDKERFVYKGLLFEESEQ